VTVVNFKNNAPIEGAEVRVGGLLEKETDSTGVAEFVFDDDKYNVDVRALGYYDVRTTRQGTRNDTIYMTVMLNRRIVLKNIYYDFDKADLRAESVKELEKIVAFLKTNPDLKIELGSHTDSRGNDDYNMRLSERRAKSVVDYIISRGISPERIVSKGYGETQLVNDCGNGVKCTEEEHQQNRRTEILILEK
jgi:outer membrane protein OmpA-like peptidoglycan-associated protein